MHFQVAQLISSSFLWNSREQKWWNVNEVEDVSKITFKVGWRKAARQSLHQPKLKYLQRLDRWEQLSSRPGAWFFLSEFLVNQVRSELHPVERMVLKNYIMQFIIRNKFIITIVFKSFEMKFCVSVVQLFCMLTYSFTNQNFKFVNHFFVKSFVLIGRDEAVETFTLDGMRTWHNSWFRNARMFSQNCFNLSCWH